MLHGSQIQTIALLMHFRPITDEKIGFLIVLVLFVREVIFIWGNFTS